MLVQIVKVRENVKSYDILRKCHLTLSAQQTKTDTCANSVDPDEMAHNDQNK